jgi:O-antigen ligase
LGGQTIFISLLLIIAFFLLSFLLGERSTRDIWLFGFSFTMLIALFAVVGLMQTRPEFITISDRNDYWERFQLWTAALEANVHWFVGVGTGDYNQVLGSYLRSHGFEEYASRSLNAHNQFIQILFSNGILGLLGVAMLLGRPLVLFMRVRYELGILAIFPFLVYGVTEVFLGRYQGVVFFALLHQLFLNEYFRNKMLPIWRENSAKI